jgi:hypothetical protein
MNKFEKMIRENGIILGQGIDRAAYLFKNKVFKLSRDDLADESLYQQQTDNEQYVYKALINQNPEFAKFFPNPSWYGRVCAVDKCTTIQDLCEDEEIEGCWIGNILDELNFSSEKIDSFLSFLKKLDEEFDILDLDTNPSNIGIAQSGDLVILDWGL